VTTISTRFNGSFEHLRQRLQVSRWFVSIDGAWVSNVSNNQRERLSEAGETGATEHR
jgi:hypothetical protein